MKETLIGSIAAPLCAALAAAGVVALYVLWDARFEGSGQTDRSDSHSPRVEVPLAKAASVNRSSKPFDAAGAADVNDKSRGASAPGMEKSSTGHASADVPSDTSQELHIEESRRNYSEFLNHPDGYRKYEYLAGVQYDHIPRLSKHVYDQYLSHHGRLGFEELLQDVRSHPDDHEGNSDRYRRMLEIVARMPCEPDEYWNGCIVQMLGVARDDVQNAQAEAALLLAEQNLAKLRGYSSYLELATPEGKAYQALYDSLAPLLSSTIEGDERVLKRFGLTADEAAAIADRVIRHDRHSTDVSGGPF